MLKLPLSLRVERIGHPVILFTALVQKFKRSTWKNRHLRRAVQNRFKLRDECTLHISCLGIRTEAVCLYTCGSAALGGRASHCPHSRLIATCTLAAAATTTTLPPPPPPFARRAPHTRSVPHTSSIAIIYLHGFEHQYRRVTAARFFAFCNQLQRDSPLERTLSVSRECLASALAGLYIRALPPTPLAYCYG